MERNPFVDAEMVKLETISESNGKLIVVINGNAFTAGERKKVKLLASEIEVHCLEIKAQSAIIATEPYWQRGELQLSK